MAPTVKTPIFKLAKTGRGEERGIILLNSDFGIRLFLYIMYYVLNINPEYLFKLIIDPGNAERCAQYQLKENKSVTIFGSRRRFMVDSVSWNFV